MKYVFLFYFLCNCFWLQAQQDPFFMPFEGPVFKIPTADMKNWKFTYSDNVLTYEKIAEVSFQELKIPDRHVDIPFPGVDRKSRYGMVLDSEMIIKQDGCYVFDLLSDDGSVFWINEQMIVDNDGTHKYRRRTDTVYIDEGRYPVRLWYYQGFVHRYGITFGGRYIEDDCKKTATLLGKDKSQKQRINISSQVLFDYDSHDLKMESKAALDSVLTLLKSKKPKNISIIGHSCSTGTEKYNLDLSQQRADRILAYFLDHSQMPGIIYRSIGLGSQSPLEPNDSEKNKANNRRVEIIAEY